MEEEYSCMLAGRKKKHHDLLATKYKDLIQSGLEYLEAIRKAELEIIFDSVDLTEAETEECFKSAKERKFYRIRTNEYFESIKKPKVQNIIPVEVFKEDVLKRLKEYVGAEEVITPDNQKQFDLLTWYFTRDVKFIDAGYSFNKGLLVYGNIGCGKTTLMRSFAKNTYQSYSVVSCRMVADKYKADGMNGITKYTDVLKNIFPHNYYGHTELGWCFDDLGTESSKKHYGDNLNVMAEILLNWYDKKGIGFNKIHMTSNLSADEIEEFYGSRVRSRMREMFNLIEFDVDSKDKRK